MKRYFLLLFVPLVAMFSGAALASSTDNQKGTEHVVPVLVAVDATGQVSSLDPAYNLGPAFVQMLSKSLNKMITQPAMRGGKPVKSQMLVKLALTMQPQDNGTSSTHVRYVSSKRVEGGGWHWVRTGYNHHLTLSQKSDGPENAEIWSRQLGGSVRVATYRYRQ